MPDEKEIVKTDIAEKVEQPKVEEPKPNIIFTGKAEAPAWRRNGEHQYHLPNDPTQKKGFYHPEARELIRAYPKDFKAFISSKGEQ